MPGNHKKLARLPKPAEISPLPIDLLCGCFVAVVKNSRLSLQIRRARVPFLVGLLEGFLTPQFGGNPPNLVAYNVQCWPYVKYMPLDIYSCGETQSIGNTD